MTRDRPPYVAQGTWRSGALHVWGWNGIDTASMAWFYGGFRTRGPDGMRVGWHDSPISYGAIGRLTVQVPDLPTMHVSSVQLDPLGVAVWLSDLPDADYVSDSIAWFARIAALARRTVSSGRILPTITQEGPFTVGRWLYAPNGPDDTLVGDTLTALAESMPPVCTLDSGADVAQIFDRLVDGIARGLLAQSGWRPELGKLRRPELQALRATFGALSKPDQVIRGNTDEFDVAIDHLRAELERHRRRAGGEPVVIPRLRLIVPDDPLEPWTVRLELVDDRDASRWCTANDVWERSASAIDVAREARYVDLLVDVIGDTVTRVAFIPGLADLALEHEPTAIELELDVAEDFIDIAPAELERLGIDLIGPSASSRPASASVARRRRRPPTTARSSSVTKRSSTGSSSSATRRSPRPSWPAPPRPVPRCSTPAIAGSASTPTNSAANASSSPRCARTTAASTRSNSSNSPTPTTATTSTR